MLKSVQLLHAAVAHETPLYAAKNIGSKLVSWLNFDATMPKLCANCQHHSVASEEMNVAVNNANICSMANTQLLDSSPESQSCVSSLLA